MCLVFLSLAPAQPELRVSSGSVVMTPPSVQEMWVRSLGGEDPLEKGMAPLSSILAQKIPWTEEPGWLSSMRLQHD